jgi:hypothetical protein
MAVMGVGSMDICGQRHGHREQQKRELVQHRDSLSTAKFPTNLVNKY